MMITLYKTILMAVAAISLALALALTTSLVLLAGIGQSFAWSFPWIQQAGQGYWQVIIGLCGVAAIMALTCLNISHKGGCK